MHFSPRGLSVKEGEVVNGLDSEDTHVAIGVVWKKTIGVRRRCGLCSLVGQQCFGLPRPPTFFGMVSKQQAASSKASSSATKPDAKAQQAARQMASRDKV